LIQIVDELSNHGVQFILSDDLTFDTTTPHGELIFYILGSIAHYERKLNRHRQKEGIRRARREGKHLGRPRIHGGKH
jgi:DNA invertase Pin-like site-specific DNA recombinase